MRSKHLVDPQLAPFLTNLPFIKFNVETLAQARQDLAAMSELQNLVPESSDVIVSEDFVSGSGDQPDVRVKIYSPSQRASLLPAVVHIHGGGYVGGAPEMNDRSNRYYAEDIGCVVISVDYRLCPETPYPGPLEDCHRALVWASENADRLGIDRNKIAVCGQSAGGGLAAALCLLARDRASVPIVFQLLVYPMLDDRTASVYDEDPNIYAGEYCWTPEDNRFGWTAMLASEPGKPGISPYAAAARCENLENLPPTFIAVGALDLFVDENLLYARQLMRAGVPTELHVYPGMIHGFDMFPSDLTNQFQHDQHEALRRALARS